MTTTRSPYQLVKSKLLSFTHDFISLPTSPIPLHIKQESAATGIPTIASLFLHPALESTLHLLNNDLPSAHFLLRHAQSDPAWECMYLHGILHRIEGDVDNARCWYGDVKDSDVLNHVWSKEAVGERGSWEEFLDRVERWRDAVARRKGSKQKVAEQEGVDWEKERGELRELSLWELKQVLGFVEGKFGTQEVRDTSDVWVQPEKSVADKSEAMIVGGEGWREF